jgi:hypothetical protein
MCSARNKTGNVPINVTLRLKTQNQNMWYLLLLHGNKVYANAPRCYGMRIVCLVNFHLQLLCHSNKTCNTVWHPEDRASWCILIMKANEMHYFSDLFDNVLYMFRTWRLRWSRGSVLAFGTQVQIRPKPSDFSGEKILSTPSFGGEVKPSVPCRALRHVKGPKSDVEVVTFGKILGHFSPIVPPSAAGFASVASDAGDLFWWKSERSKSLVLLQVGGLTCCWQRHTIKPSCWECSTTVEQAETQPEL